MNLTAAVQTLVLESLQAAYDEYVGITLESDLGDIGFDSLGLTAVVARAESEYDVEFSPEHILEMYQSMLVADLAQAIETGIIECSTAARDQSS
jgi:acyl carrier protein